MTQEEAIEQLQGLREPIIDEFRKLASGEAGGWSDDDNYVTGTVNRAVSIINSFCLLISVEPLGAIALIRIHLDTVIRFHAAALAKNRPTFVRDVMSGARLDKMKLRPELKSLYGLDNNKLTDTNIIAILEKDLKIGIKSIYDEYCQDIHFSPKTMKMAVHYSSEGIICSIGTNNLITEEQRMIAITDMSFITSLFIASFVTYVNRKSTLSSKAK